MNNTQYYSVNKPDVVNETIEGEVIMINMKSGNYYSVDRVGADLWSLVEGGSSVEQIVAALTSKYGADASAVQTEVDRFLSELVSEELVRASEGGGADSEVALAPAAEGDTFQPPHLDKYDDLQDLLLADPIHDVDAGGWPNNPDA